IPSCQSCHALGPKPRSPDFPALAGQPEWYLARQLVLWRDGKRGGTPFAPVMEAIAERMTEEQIDAVSAWYAGRPRSDR
ncbi:MAG: c-type cytochrome, partial [Paracoccus sp. (in: a-proteobacteria)]